MIEKSGQPYCPLCGLKVAGLLAALQEMRAAMAATMRVISMHADGEHIIEGMVVELRASGIPDGFGVRAQQAIHLVSQPAADTGGQMSTDNTLPEAVREQIPSLLRQAITMAVEGFHRGDYSSTDEIEQLLYDIARAAWEAAAQQERARLARGHCKACGLDFVVLEAGASHPPPTPEPKP